MYGSVMPRKKAAKKRASARPARQLTPQGEGIFVVEPLDAEGVPVPAPPRPALVLPPAPQVTAEEREQIVKMFDVWKNVLRHHWALERTVTRLKNGGPLRRERELPLRELQLARFERALADVAAEGRGLGKLEDLVRPFVEAQVGLFVHRAESLLRECMAASATPESYLSQVSWDLSSLARDIGSTRELFVDAFCNEDVQGTLGTDGARKAAIVFAALLLKVNIRTVYRMLERVRTRAVGLADELRGSGAQASEREDG